MKKIICIVGFILFFNSINSFSNTVEKNRKEFKSKIKYVYGYSKDLKGYLYLGISFEKVIVSEDTAYFVKLKLDAPEIESRMTIYFNKANSVTFISKSGKTVDLQITDVKSVINVDNQEDHLLTTIKESTYSTIFILNVTKEELIDIGSEPYCNVIIPYSDGESKVNKKVEFSKKALFGRRRFIQKYVKYILDV
ncbi:hypothetical protein L3073_04425 [Ancylomarina sp. DW003]|nr:hypothetical protein [Ancylomarina sp. DW003]MDE5421446.1 hypothetical protein [Ancylomarina sp. DW003]